MQDTKVLGGMYHSLFDKFGVDIVLEGHVHNYQRSYPIACNPKNLSGPIVTSASENNYNNPEGQIYVIVGTGGVKRTSHSSEITNCPLIR